MMETQRWALPLLAAGQAQKEITHNEALLAIDRWLHAAVVSRAATAPPETATPGDCHIVGPDAVGEWQGQQAALAMFDGFGWTLSQPRTGCLAWVCDERLLVIFDDGQWHEIGRLAGN
jgi:hypothetical protein